MVNRFTLFSGNRLEVLADILCELVATPLDSVMAPEIIVVQSRGMERWVSTRMARKHGICANVQFPFPNALIYDHLIYRILPELADRPPLAVEEIAFRILAVLPGLLAEPDFSEVAAYVGADVATLQSVQFARRIAVLFDQYRLHRPDWIIEWEAGEGTHWQAQLWRAVAGARTGRHPAALARQVFQHIAAAPERASRLPQRISVFGISYLPRFHLEMLQQLSRYCDINLFVLNPCMAYWGDMVSGKERRRMVRDAGGLPAAEGGAAEASLHPLLAACGQMGRDFFETAYALEPELEGVFQEPGRDCLLHVLQTDILHSGTSPEEGTVRVDPVPLSEEDRSVVINACHSPMREVEVLHDHLLSALNRDETLQPRDILIMTPDIETYSPFIQAVFDRPAGEPAAIPYAIADRGAVGKGRLAEGFLAFLDAVESRHEATRTVSVLETPAVLRRFGMSDAEMATVRQWMLAARIRWGRDDGDRSAHGLPATAAHTWREGVDRLLLGYALGEGESRLFHRLLPTAAADAHPELFGRFLGCLDTYFRWTERLSGSRTVDAWASRIIGMLSEMFEPGPEEVETELVIRQEVTRMAESAGQAGFEGRVGLAVVREWLSDRLSAPGGGGFLVGGVTFCAMLPMRSIPFRILGVLGMDVAAFPRRQPDYGFDLMARHPRKGDPNRREDDRYLFLEALLSAREQLYISYVGRNIQDNAPIPPSVLVSELMEAVEGCFSAPEAGSAAARIHTVQRLQPFHPDYFDDDGPERRLKSYSRHACRTAQALLAPKKEIAPFISEGLPPPDALWRHISLADLTAFFRNPAAFLLNRRLGLYLEAPDAELTDTEPFDLDGLTRYAWKVRLIRSRLQGRELAGFEAIARGAGDLPHGTVGACCFDEICDAARTLADRAAPYLSAPRMPDLALRIALEAFSLSGTLVQIHQDHQVVLRPGKIRPVDRLAAWIAHLCLICEKREGYPAETLLVGEDDVRRYRAPENAAEILSGLLSLYWSGLRRPLPFFPESSRAYSERRTLKQADHEEGVRHARRAWETAYFRPENGDPYFHRCFRHADPLDDRFGAVADAVWEPEIIYGGKA